MISPIRRKAEQLDTEARLPQDNWLARRTEAIQGHQQSVANGVQALRDIGSIIIGGNISTDLQTNPLQNPQTP